MSRAVKQDRLRRGRVIPRKDGAVARCPHCGKVMPMGVWALVHWREGVTGTCQSCGQKFALGATK